MPEANSLAELEKMIKDEMRKAMKNISRESLDIMKQETAGFYTGGSPSMYERTGALGQTPKVEPIKDSGNVMELEAKLDDSHVYGTGDQPGMAQVLQLADQGKPWRTKNGKLARPNVGTTGFWERADNRIKVAAFQEFAERFN